MASTKNKENVASYPRPPLIEQTTKRLRVVLQDSSGSEQVLADSVSAYRICETSSPPTYYIPVKDVKMHLFKQNSKSTFCEWKGYASYYDLLPEGGSKADSRVWTYHKPNGRYAAIKDHVSFYVGPWKCYIDDEEVKPQPGSFYGGWWSSDIEGPVKGAPGTLGW